VVKAVNTTFAGTLVAGQVAGQTLDVFIAGDDTGAKGAVAGLVTAGGMRAIDVGALERARQLEALALLGITLQFSLGTQFMSGWKFVSKVSPLRGPPQTRPSPGPRFRDSCAVEPAEGAYATGTTLSSHTSLPDGCPQELLRAETRLRGCPTHTITSRTTRLVGCVLGDRNACLPSGCG
jgi:hypothetical protein